MPGPMEFDFGFTTHGAGPRRPAVGLPLRILVMADFSGRGAHGLGIGSPPLAERQLLKVDVDNLETLLARLAPRVEFDLVGADVATSFSTLEDFHPDALYTRLPLFESLRATRAQLLNPATFAEAAAGLALPSGPTESITLKPPAVESDTEILQRLLGQRPGGGAEQQQVTELLRQWIAPRIAAEIMPILAHQDLYLAAVDGAAAMLMRALLHHPDFQALEASWRSLHSLVSGLETGTDLQILILDVTRSELLQDIQGAAGEWQGCGLYRLLVEHERALPGGQPWSLLVGDYRFGPGAEDVALLAALGALACQAGGPFVAQADLSLLGCREVAELAEPRTWRALEDEAAQRWQILRRSPIAAWLGLALPRLLLRLPYGAQGERVAALPFEELPGVPEPEALLWGNPAYACAWLIGRAFEMRGWEMCPGDVLDLVDLPQWAYRIDGESHIYPCAEVWLSERAAEAISDLGLMPVVSIRDCNAVRWLSFQSLAEPKAALAGMWH